MKTYRFTFIVFVLALHMHAATDAQCLTGLSKEDLSREEIQSLRQMREEEFLAHDVYLAFSEKYTLPAFKNIRESEKQHTSSVKALLDRYELKDPAENHKTGEFSDPRFRDLYIRLVEEGSASYEDAVRAGLQIEDMDIADLEDALDREVDNEDIRMVYQNLLKASMNHRKAWYIHASRSGLE